MDHSGRLSLHPAQISDAQAIPRVYIPDTSGQSKLHRSHTMGIEPHQHLPPNHVDNNVLSNPTREYPSAK
jgi:hypothetical protein